MEIKEERLSSLISRLNVMLGVDGSMPSVSPSSRYNPAGAIQSVKITKELNLEQLSKEQLTLVHVQLHQFYPTGAKDLSSGDIEQLHKKIRTLINHEEYDRLDRNG